MSEEKLLVDPNTEGKTVTSTDTNSPLADLTKLNPIETNSQQVINLDNTKGETKTEKNILSPEPKEIDKEKETDEEIEVPQFTAIEINNSDSLAQQTGSLGALNQDPEHTAPKQIIDFTKTLTPVPQETNTTFASQKTDLKSTIATDPKPPSSVTFLTPIPLSKKIPVERSNLQPFQKKKPKTPTNYPSQQKPDTNSSSSSEEEKTKQTTPCQNYPNNQSNIIPSVLPSSYYNASRRNTLMQPNQPTKFEYQAPSKNQNFGCINIYFDSDTISNISLQISKITPCCNINFLKDKDQNKIGFSLKFISRNKLPAKEIGTFIQEGVLCIKFASSQDRDHFMNLFGMTINDDSITTNQKHETIVQINPSFFQSHQNQYNLI